MQQGLRQVRVSSAGFYSKRQKELDKLEFRPYVQHTDA
jgi:hypothetical protein